MKQIFIDVETTGVEHWRNSVHQISGAVYIDNEQKETFDFKVRPHEKAKIELEALKIGGLTLEQVLAYPHRMEAYKGLTDILTRYVSKYDKTDKFFFCAYNAHFDNAFTRAFFKQCGDNYFGSFFWSNPIDVMVLAGEHLKDVRPQMENFKLMTVARQLGIEIKEEELHNAIYDIEITKQVYDIVTANK